MSWHSLPTELHLAIVHLLPHHDIRALAFSAAALRALCLPAIYADVVLPSTRSLRAFATHVPHAYGAYVRSLAISTDGDCATGATDPILAILDTCTRLQSLSLSLASPIDPQKLVPAFARLRHVHTFQIGCGGREEMTPVSERLVVALAASLPSLSHLTLARITRSAIHVDPCDVPFGVPIVTNDFDVPHHPLLESSLSLPNLLRLPSLRTLDIRDTWLGCDTQIDLVAPGLEKLALNGSMYASDPQACTAWLFACPMLTSLELGTGLAPLAQPQAPPRVAHVHVNASRVPVDDLASTLDALTSCRVESISIGYEDLKTEDDFAQDDLQDWSAAVEAFLLGRSKDAWSALTRVAISFAPDAHASWAV